MKALASTTSVLMILFSAAVLATEPVNGVWTGKIKFDFSKLPATLDQKAKDLMIANAKKRAESKLRLELKANHTFNLSASGVGAAAQPVTGNWSQTDHSVILQKFIKGKSDVLLEFQFDKAHKTFSYSTGPSTMIFSR